MSSAPALNRVALDPTPPSLDGWDGTSDATAGLARFAAQASPARLLLEFERANFNRASSRPFRATSLALMAGCLVAFFATARRLNLPFAWLAAALWAVNALGSGTITQLAAQPTLLATLFGLLATLAFLRASGVDRREVVPPTRIRLPRSPLVLRSAAVVLMLAGLLCSPAAAVFPALWLVVGTWKLGRSFARSDKTIAVVLVAAGLVYGVATRVALSGDPIASLPLDLVRRIALAPRFAWMTLANSVLPQAAVWHPMTGPTAFDWAAIALVAVGGAALSLRTSSPSIRAALAAGSALSLVGMLLAARPLGEIGVIDGQLWFASSIVAIALAAAVRAIADRLAARRAADDSSAADIGEPEGLDERPWRRPAIGLGVLTAVAIAAAPAFARSLAFATGPTVSASLADRSPVAARERLAEAMERGDAGVAQAAASDFVRLSPDRGEALLLQARVTAAIEPDSAQQVLATLRDAAAASPRSSRIHAALADALYRAGNPAEGQTEFARAVELDPSNLQAKNNWATVLRAGGDLATAEKIYRDILGRDRTFVPAAINLAGLLYESNRPEMAVSVLSASFKANPNDSRLCTAVGLALLANHQTEAAIAAFRGSVMLAPTASSLTNLANALATTGEIDEARFYFDRALKLQPDFAPASAGLAQLPPASTTAATGNRF